jgi:putative glutamine amidotransferase
MRHFILSILISFFTQAYFAHDSLKVYIASSHIGDNVKNYVKKFGPEVELIDFSLVEKTKIHELLRNCRGLLLLGGKDINPALYKKEKLKSYCSTDLKRDSLELILLKWADSSQVPIMGICRGMQFINAYFGGTLCVDIPNFCKPTKVKELHRDPKRQKDVYHKITIEPNSILSTCFQGVYNLNVNSFHHQCVDELAPPLKVVARSEGGIIEAIENDPEKRKTFILAVQWHPERMFENIAAQQVIFERFVNAVVNQ